MVEELPSDADLKTAAEAYLEAHHWEWRRRRELADMLKKRTEDAVMIGNVIITLKQHRYEPDELSVKQYLRVG